jgi:hypothetical protein
MSTTGQTGYLTQLLAAMRLSQTGTATAPTDAELEAVNIQAFDGDLKAIAALTGTTGFLKKTGLNTWVLDTTGYLTSITSSQVTTALGYTPVTDARTLTINGVSYDLTANRSWTIAGGVTSFNTRTGAITLLSTDITSTLGYTPYNATNPAGYISSYTETDPTVGSHIKAITTTNISNWNTAYGWGNHSSAGYLTGITSGQVTTALGYTPENATNKGVANGYASLDGSGLVPSTQLPSYVDDVLEYTNLASFPATGTTGKIYIDLATNKVYRWSGTVYIEVSPTVGTIWGGITGTLANQTDLQTALDAKVPTSRTITINGTAFDLSANRSWTINSMVYPAAGIAVSTGTAWAASITDNSGNWNTAYTNRISSLTVTGSSGSATLVSNVLNIPTYTLAGLGGQASSTNLTSLSGLSYVSASFVKMTAAGTFTLDTNTYYLSSNPSSYIALTALSSTATGLTYTNTTGVFSLTTGYSIPTTASQTNWDTAYTNRITSLTTTGSSGSATLTTNTLNIPTYTLAGLGGQASSTNLTSLSGLTFVSTSFVKMTAAGTFALDTNAYYLSSNPSGYTSNTGTVTSVSGTGTVSGLSLSGTVTTTGNITLGGTLAVTASNFSSQTANTFLAAPNGAAGVPTFRTIVAADIPTLNQSTTGSAGSVANSLILKADTGTTEGTDLYTYNGSAAKTLNIVAGSNITISKAAGQWTIAAAAGATGTVSSVSVTTANGISGTVATSTTTPAITLTLGAITPTSVNSVVISGSTTPTLAVTGTSSISGSNTGDNAVNSLYSGLVSNATHTGDATGATALTVVGLRGVALPTLGVSAGLLKYTGTGTNTWVFDTTAYGTGSVTSVSGTGTVSGLTLTGTVTTNGSLTLGGTLSVLASNFASQTANTFLAAPNGAAGTPTFRTIVAADIPTLNQNTTGTASTITGVYSGTITSSQITTGLGFTPYNSTNPSGYITASSDITGSAAKLTSADLRTIAPNNHSTARATFGFTSWANNNTSPYADYIHLRSYIDSSGGSDNLIMFRKDALGIRIWQQTYGSATAYATYKDVAWTDGTNASGTWGISISGNAATATSATSAGNATTAGGFTPSQTSGTANRIVVADANGYIVNNYFYASGGGSERNASGMGYFAGHNTSDYYYRSYTAAAAAALLSGQTMNINGSSTSCTGNAATVTNGIYTTNYTTYTLQRKGNQGAVDLNSSSYYNGTQALGFDVATNKPGGSYGVMLNIQERPDTSGQLVIDYSTGDLFTRGVYTPTPTFSAWRTILHSGNWNTYAPGLTGGGASGTWGISISGNAATATSATTATTAGSLTSMNISQFTNNSGYITGITSANVTTALGYTPYNSTNPSGYITSSGSITGSSGSVTGLTLTSSANGINPDSVTQNQIGYNTSVSLFGQTDGGLYSSAYSSSWIHQIYGDFRTGQIAIRGKNNGTWQSWRTVLDSSNYTSYAPSTTGSGASGTWGISITGNANYATTAGSAPNGSNANGAYNVSPGEGNGVYFWSDSTNYTIKMGYTAGTYQYGPVTDYSMRFTMGAGTGRGFTWGYAGAAPTMGLNANSGNLQIAGTFTEASSIRYKEDIQDLTYSVEDVLKLRGVTYKKKGTSHTEIGVIAEEVNAIIPEVVAKNLDGSVESVSYGRLTAVLIEAIKEQQKQIDELKNLLNK